MILPPNVHNYRDLKALKDTKKQIEGGYGEFTEVKHKPKQVSN